MKDEIRTVFENIGRVKREKGITYPITVVAATKTIDPERINLLPEYGINIAGENRVQELIEKYDSVRGVKWHFIGSLQTNKVKYIVDKVELIHSVDREELADEIDKRSAKIGKVTDVLVEVNTGEEASKSGVMPEKAEALAAYVAAKKNVRLRGVMGVFPIGAADELYEKLYGIYRKIADTYPEADVLSAGMSGDYLKAIAHGANLVRIGSAIFGKRIYTERQTDGKI